MQLKIDGLRLFIIIWFSVPLGVMIGAGYTARMSTQQPFECPVHESVPLQDAESRTAHV